MKINSGIYSGIKLDTIIENTTRPTIDRAKQGIFNAIQFFIEDKVVIDFFAGSGAMGLESLSRGAKFAYFIEINPKAITCIKNNIKKLPNLKNYKIINASYKTILNKLFQNNDFPIFDIIFLDPPYKLEVAFEEIISHILNNQLLAKDGYIVLETHINANLSFLTKYPNLQYKKYQYGKILMILCKFI